MAESESVTDLEGLYNVEATFKYTSCNGLVQALCAFVDRTFLDSSDHTVLVTSFPPELFEMESEGSDWPAIPPKKKLVYFLDSQILIFTMPGRPHELVSRAINELLCDKLKQMNCRKDLVTTGAADQILQNIGKQPDESWGPAVAHYPTCVLEVGVSESLRQLDRDAQRWIGTEASHVTQVVTAKIYPHRTKITFAVWRRTTGHQAVMDEEICIEWHDGQPTARDNISLCISFEQMFERPPISGTAEGDLIFSKQELGSIACSIWQDMDLIPRG